MISFPENQNTTTELTLHKNAAKKILRCQHLYEIKIFSVNLVLWTPRNNKCNACDLLVILILKPGKKRPNDINC